MSLVLVFVESRLHFDVENTMISALSSCQNLEQTELTYISVAADVSGLSFDF